MTIQERALAAVREALTGQGAEPQVIEQALQAAAAVPLSDDPAAYALDVARAARGVLEAALVRAKADLRRARREVKIAQAVTRATALPTGPLRH